MSKMPLESGSAVSPAASRALAWRALRRRQKQRKRQMEEEARQVEEEAARPGDVKTWLE